MSIASRDDGLRQVSRITRWSAAAGVAFTGIFGVMVAKAQPGKTLPRQPPAAASQDQTTAPTDSSASSTGSSQDNPGLQAPQLPPIAASGSGQVVSGGS